MRYVATTLALGFALFGSYLGAEETRDWWSFRLQKEKVRPGALNDIDRMVLSAGSDGILSPGSLQLPISVVNTYADLGEQNIDLYSYSLGAQFDRGWRTTVFDIEYASTDVPSGGGYQTTINESYLAFSLGSGPSTTTSTTLTNAQLVSVGAQYDRYRLMYEDTFWLWRDQQNWLSGVGFLTGVDTQVSQYQSDLVGSGVSAFSSVGETSGTPISLNFSSSIAPLGTVESLVATVSANLGLKYRWQFDFGLTLEGVVAWGYGLGRANYKQRLNYITTVAIIPGSPPLQTPTNLKTERDLSGESEAFKWHLEADYRLHESYSVALRYGYRETRFLPNKLEKKEKVGTAPPSSGLGPFLPITDISQYIGIELRYRY
ncbi:MAG: hypothetical protein KDK33_00085 [Leptospiraceae bacterium]|nr:hypothetical protein [Leptospiraceae bacterium]